MKNTNIHAGRERESKKLEMNESRTLEDLLPLLESFKP